MLTVRVYTRINDFIISQQSEEDEKLPALNLLICLVARYITVNTSGLPAWLVLFNPTQSKTFLRVPGPN